MAINTEKPMVFVIDDEIDLLENYEALLSDLFHVKSFQGPQLFLQHIKSEGSSLPDLVISDLKMPEMDGIQMVQKAQQLNAYFPFIILSGYLEKESMIRALELGAFRLLEKPLDSEALLGVLDELLLEHQARSVRRELNSVNKQIAEIFNILRMIADQYVPTEVKDRFFTTSENGKVTSKMSFDEVIDELERKQKKLQDSEHIIEKLKTTRFRSFQKMNG